MGGFLGHLGFPALAVLGHRPSYRAPGAGYNAAKQSIGELMKFRTATWLLLATLGAVFAVSTLKHRYDIVLMGPIIEDVFFSIAIIPFCFWLYALLEVGRRKAEVLPSGGFRGRMRWGAYLIFLGGGGLFIFISLIGISAAWPPASLGDAGIIGILFGSFGLVGAYSMAQAFLGELSWNDKMLTATTRLLRQKTHRWSDLRRVTDSDEYETILHFEGTGKARIHSFYEGHDEVLQKARDILNNA
ncbi:hypothetical protein [Roseovarius sp.]|uniref:hypothetical protein n=1 Tax=Roseovarius sp. TaxID=1486281 RepID=UPI003BAD8200